MLENKFKILCQNFSKNEKLITQLWQEIKTAHSEPTRYYHTLKHLEHIYKELQTFKLSPILEFSIFYHDIVYDAKKRNNEEQSAHIAKQRLEQLTIRKELNTKVCQLILETKMHKASSLDNELFLDADLSILASDEKTYEKYIYNVRKEYAIYDDVSYFKGRKKVIKLFLEKERIYMSEDFHELYEKKARENLEQELTKLCSL